MAVQPGGKILVAGAATPGFGMLARLDPDGSLDSTFGDGGYVIDRGSAPFTDLVVQPDGRIVALNAWMRLRCFERDGDLDLGFGEGGTGVRVPAGILDAPSVLVLLPDGRLALGGNYHVKMSTNQALAFVYDADGRSVEQVGKLGPAPTSWFGAENSAGSLTALALLAEGSLLMAGSIRPNFNSSEGHRSVLARFVPGARFPYDPLFGGGAGLVTVPHSGGSNPSLNSLAPVPGGIYAAGSPTLNPSRILLARFTDEGLLDGGFGSGGFAEVSPGPGLSQGNDLAVQGDGRVVVAGEAVNGEGRTGRSCRGCRSPVLTRFLPDGTLDPAFGVGGVARITGADGSPARARGEAVAALPDGDVLIAGLATSQRPRVLVSRVRPDGQVDRSFGSAGVVAVDACPGNPAAQRRSRCLPALRAQMRVRRLPGHRTALHLRVTPNVGWASITRLKMTLPRQLEAIEHRGRQVRSALVESDGRKRSAKVAVTQHQLRVKWPFGARSISLSAPARALRKVKEVGPRRRLPFRVEIWFGTRSVDRTAGTQAIVLRRAIG